MTRNDVSLSFPFTLCDTVTDWQTVLNEMFFQCCARSSWRRRRGRWQVSGCRRCWFWTGSNAAWKGSLALCVDCRATVTVDASAGGECHLLEFCWASVCVRGWLWFWLMLLCWSEEIILARDYDGKGGSGGVTYHWLVRTTLMRSGTRVLVVMIMMMMMMMKYLVINCVEREKERESKREGCWDLRGRRIRKRKWKNKDKE